MVGTGQETQSSLPGAEQDSQGTLWSLLQSSRDKFLLCL